MDDNTTVLYVVDNINEDDQRIYNQGLAGGVYTGPFGMYGIDDPKMYTSYSFGKTLADGLNNMGDGYSAKVTDYGKWVTVTVSRHNHISGKSVEKTFLIVFQNKGDGIVMQSHSKWRTISGVSQALSHIKNICSGMRSATN